MLIVSICSPKIKQCLTCHDLKISNPRNHPSCMSVFSDQEGAFSSLGEVIEEFKDFTFGSELKHLFQTSNNAHIGSSLAQPFSPTPLRASSMKPLVSHLPLKQSREISPVRSAVTCSQTPESKEIGTLTINSKQAIFAKCKPAKYLKVGDSQKAKTEIFKNKKKSRKSKHLIFPVIILNKRLESDLPAMEALYDLKSGFPRRAGAKRSRKMNLKPYIKNDEERPFVPKFLDSVLVQVLKVQSVQLWKIHSNLLFERFDFFKVQAGHEGNCIFFYYRKPVNRVLSKAHICFCFYYVYMFYRG